MPGFTPSTRACRMTIARSSCSIVLTNDEAIDVDALGLRIVRELLQ